MHKGVHGMGPQEVAKNGKQGLMLQMFIARVKSIIFIEALLYIGFILPLFTSSFVLEKRLMGKCLDVMGKSLFFSWALWWVKVLMGKCLMGKSLVKKYWWVNVLMGKCLETIFFVGLSLVFPFPFRQMPESCWKVIMVVIKGPYTNIDISWINAKFGTTADWLLKHIINNATYFKNFVAMKRRDNLNCCKNIKTKWPQNSWNRLRWVNSCDSGIDPRSRIFTKMIFLLLEISLNLLNA